MHSPRVDVGVLALVTGVLVGDELLVGLEDLGELLVGDVVQEGALSELAVGNGQPLLSVSGLLDGSGGEAQELGVELGVVDGESDLGGEGEPLVTHGVGEHASGVGEGDRVGHVDHDGVSVP